MIRLMNSVSGFDFFAGRTELHYGLDEQIDTCVWNKHELKAFPEVRIVPVEEMIAELKGIRDGKQMRLAL